jgi:CheY-like chemotaxis protein
MLTKVESNRIVATDRNSGHIVIVDDDPAVRRLISDYFGQQGSERTRAGQRVQRPDDGNLCRR